MKTLLILLASAAVLTPRICAAGSEPGSTPALLEKGKAAHAAQCAVCHGDKGDGNGPAGAVLNPRPRNFVAGKYKGGNTPEQVFETLSKGMPATGMPGYGYLSEEERWALVHYVLAFGNKSK